MSNASWPKFSFTEILKPPEGWATDHAILSTYSADLIVIVTSLLALRGYDLDGDRPSSRVELVRAIEGSAAESASWRRREESRSPPSSSHSQAARQVPVDGRRG